MVKRALFDINAGTRICASPFSTCYLVCEELALMYFLIALTGTIYDDLTYCVRVTCFCPPADYPAKHETVSTKVRIVHSRQHLFDVHLSLVNTL